MDSKYKYVLLDDAIEDFEKIYNYISNTLLNEASATKLSDKFDEALERVCLFPESCPVYKEYRKLIVENFLIFYKINEKEKRIVVYCAMFGMRNYEEYL